MTLSNLCVRTGRILSLIDWEEVLKIVFHGLIAFAVGIYVAGEFLGKWVHQANDWLAHHWVRLIVPPTPAEGQALIVVEEVSPPALPVEVELMLPPAPLMVEDPWSTPIEVELKLPLETMAILFTVVQPMLTAAQAPVALLAAGKVVQQPPPAATNRRRRGRRAHADRKRQPA